jgi:hypothetical protein
LSITARLKGVSRSWGSGSVFGSCVDMLLFISAVPCGTLSMHGLSDQTSFISSHTTLLYQCFRHIYRSHPISRSTDLYLQIYRSVLLHPSSSPRKTPIRSYSDPNSTLQWEPDPAPARRGGSSRRGRGTGGQNGPQADTVTLLHPRHRVTV